MIRLLTYNIEFMMGWPQTVDVIRAQEADIICLQEVARDDCANGAYVRRSDVLEAFDRTHEYKRLDRFYHGCSMGNMTLVRGRIGPGRQLCADGGKPYGVATDVELDSSRLTVANIHLAPLLRPNLLAFAVAERKHYGEVSDLNRRFADHDGAVVAAGDFNSFWPAPGCRLMRRHWIDCRTARNGRQPPTRPTFGLPFVIDHVFVRGKVRPVEYRVIEGGGSDHRAVVVGLEFEATSGRSSTKEKATILPNRRPEGKERRLG